MCYFLYGSLYGDVAEDEYRSVLDKYKYKITLGTIQAADFRYTVVFLIVVAVLVLAGRLGWRFLIFGASRKIERDMRNDLFSHLLTLPQQYFHAHKAGEVMALMTNDLEAIRMTFAATVMMHGARDPFSEKVMVTVSS